MKPLNAVRWLIRDTFRQARASGIFWLMLAVSLLCAAVCLTAKITEYDRANPPPGAPTVKATLAVASVVADGAAQAHGFWPRMAAFHSKEYQQAVAAQQRGLPLLTAAKVELLYGMIEFPIYFSGPSAVRTLQLLLVGWVADAAGLLLALIWTASFLPSFLETSAASVLLAKPMPRWGLLVGKFIGVVSYVGFQTILFLALTWVALAACTGDWELHYFRCLPLLLMHFAVFYSFSALLAVATRSTVACAFGSVLFWILCWGVNFGRHATAVLPEMQAMSGGIGSLLEISYWILPKPLDFHLLLMESLGAENLFVRLLDVKVLASRGLWHPGLSLLASLLFGAVLLVLSGYEFLTKDY